jgi:RNA polymerase sigma factor (sigma-70 family)
MSEPQSVTQWIQGARAGQDDAFQRLWERYYERLVALARRRLGQTPRRSADEEDIAVSAFGRFAQLIQDGRFPESADRDDLWRLLISIAAGKIVDYIREETSQKRGRGDVRGESVFRAELSGSSRLLGGIDQIVGDEPTPEFVAEVTEQFRGMMDALGDDSLRSIAQWKLEGYTNVEVAERNACSLSTVERSLKLIRTKWEREEA